MNWIFIGFGYLASALFSVLFIPQLVKIFKTKQVRDLSFIFIVINIIANTCNIIFGTGLYLDGLKQASMPILTGCSVAFIWSIMMFIFKIAYSEEV